MSQRKSRSVIQALHFSCQANYQFSNYSTLTFLCQPVTYTLMHKQTFSWPLISSTGCLKYFVLFQILQGVLNSCTLCVLCYSLFVFWALFEPFLSALRRGGVSQHFVALLIFACTSLRSFTVWRWHPMHICTVTKALPAHVLLPKPNNSVLIVCGIELKSQLDFSAQLYNNDHL